MVAQEQQKSQFCSALEAKLANSDVHPMPDCCCAAFGFPEMHASALE